MKIAMWVVTAALLLGVSSIGMAKGDVASGKAKAASCAACHGAAGEGNGRYPALAGKSEDDIEHALKDFKAGKRSNAMMKPFAANLSEQDMENLGAYYASLKK